MIILQKQPLEVFCKKRCLHKFRKIYRKASVPKSLFLIKMAQVALAQVFSREFCQIFMNTFLYRTPRVAASNLGDTFCSITFDTDDTTLYVTRLLISTNSFS